MPGAGPRSPGLVPARTWTGHPTRPPERVDQQGRGLAAGGGAWFRLDVLGAGLRMHFRRTAARGAVGLRRGGGAPAARAPAQQVDAGAGFRIRRRGRWRRAAWPTRSYPELACSSPSLCTPPACESAAGLGWGRPWKSGREREGTETWPQLQAASETWVKVDSGRGIRGTRARLGT